MSESGGSNITVAQAAFLDAAISSRATAGAAWSTLNTAVDQGTYGAGAVLADSGALAAGNYDVFASLAGATTGAGGVLGSTALEHRNAANGANIRTALLTGQQTTIAATLVLPALSGQVTWYRVVVALNERFRIIKGIADVAPATQGWSLEIRPAS